MLIIKRRLGERVEIGDTVLTVIRVSSKYTVLGFEGPRGTRIARLPVDLDKDLKYELRRIHQGTSKVDDGGGGEEERQATELSSSVSGGESESDSD